MCHSTPPPVTKAVRPRPPPRHSDVLVQMFGRHAQDDRVMLPLLNTLDALLTHQLLPPGDLLRVLESVKAELAGGPKKDVNKSVCRPSSASTHRTFINACNHWPVHQCP